MDNLTLVDAYGIVVVKNVMLFNWNHRRLRTSIQSLIIDMLQKEVWDIGERRNMFHGLVPAKILQQYCIRHSMKEFIIRDVMT